MKFEHVLLGFVAMRPCTGYDLKRWLDSEMGRMIRLRTQQSQIYRTLGRMCDSRLGRLHRRAQRRAPGLEGLPRHGNGRGDAAGPSRRAVHTLAGLRRPRVPDPLHLRDLPEQGGADPPGAHRAGGPTCPGGAVPRPRGPRRALVAEREPRPDDTDPRPRPRLQGPHAGHACALAGGDPGRTHGLAQVRAANAAKAAHQAPRPIDTSQRGCLMGHDVIACEMVPSDLRSRSMGGRRELWRWGP